MTPAPKIPAGEREFIREELTFIAGRLMKNCRLSVAECRRVIEEVLSCSV